MHHALEVGNPLAWVGCPSIGHEDEVDGFLVDGFAGDAVGSVEDGLEVSASSSVADARDVDMIWFLSFVDCSVVGLEVDDRNPVIGSCPRKPDDFVQSSLESLYQVLPSLAAHGSRLIQSEDKVNSSHCHLVLCLVVVDVFEIVSPAILGSCDQPCVFKPGLVVGIDGVVGIIIEPGSSQLLLPVVPEFFPGHVLPVVLHDVSRLQILASCHEGFFLSASIDVVPSQGSHLVTVKAFMVGVFPFIAADPSATGALLSTDHHLNLADKVEFLLHGKCLMVLETRQQFVLVFFLEKFGQEFLHV